VPDLILTGLPRSGTTLAAAIIDRAPDALCLSEPESHVELMTRAADAEDFVARLGQEFDTVRRTILAGGSVLDRRHADGAPVTNYFADPAADGRRETAFTIRGIARPGLSADFVLGVKHNALYAAVLPEIIRSERFRVVAMVRDPVALLMSWQSLDLPISRGRLPAGERFWPELAALGKAELDLIDKQARIADLLFSRFAQWSDRIAVIPYEIFVTDPARLLTAAAVRAPVSSQISAVVQRMPASRYGNHGRAALTERIGQLMAAGQLPGIARYYPQSGREASKSGRL
jgi:hypothetical protein